MKTCYRCKRKLPLTEFHVCRKIIGGRLNQCKTCQKMQMKINRDSKIDHYREKDREKGTRIQKSIFRIRYPFTLKAHNAVRRAIKKGILNRKPCEKCGVKKVEAHHDDYKILLTVRWLCCIHHNERHAYLRKIGKDPLENYVD